MERHKPPQRRPSKDEPPEEQSNSFSMSRRHLADPQGASEDEDGGRDVAEVSSKRTSSSQQDTDYLPGTLPVELIIELARKAPSLADANELLEFYERHLARVDERLEQAQRRLDAEQERLHRHLVLEARLKRAEEKDAGQRAMLDARIASTEAREAHQRQLEKLNLYYKIGLSVGGLILSAIMIGIGLTGPGLFIAGVALYPLAPELISKYFDR